MKQTIALISATAVIGGLLSSCGGGSTTANTGTGTTTGSSSGSGTPTSTTQEVDTAQVLALARESSETSEPFAVDNGAFAFTDTSETSEPIAVTGS